jgi:class 3 adenylate cyclase
VLSLGSLVVFTLTRRYDWFRLTQLTLMLVLPFALMLVLGGFIPSSVVAAWAFVAPLGALAFATPREAVRWFLAYMALVVVSGILGGSIRTANSLPPAVVLAFFVLNIAGVSLIVFLALYAFVRERDRAFEAMRRLFGQYLSPEIARALLSDPARARLGGEIRDITALFADLQGFTPFTEARPPVETVRVLNRYFSAVVPVIFANGGTIIQFAGDAIVAVFNAPLEQPRHALAAARTALAMQAAIEAIVRQDPALPRFRVGIATGAALVGNVGSEEFRNFVAHGDAVNLAARLQTGAQAGHVVVSAPTYALIRDVAQVTPLGRFSVKGKSEEVEAFVLEGLAR